MNQKNKEYNDSFNTRLRKALAETKIKWHPIPVALGIAFLGLAQLYRVNEREKARRFDDEREDDEEPTGRPKRRERIRPSGPWWVICTSVFQAIADICKASPSHVYSSIKGHVQTVG